MGKRLKSRMTSVNIGLSLRIAALPYEPHDAQKFFSWMFLKADCEGRMPADPNFLRNLVAPHCNYTSEEIGEWLDLMEAQKDDLTGRGLIERYEVSGHKYLWFPDWEKYQPEGYTRKEAPSNIPPPPERSKAKRSDVTHIEVKQSAAEGILDQRLAAMAAYYEEHIGKLATPSDIEKLKDFYDTYPEGWFEKAIDEAVAHGARSLRYVEKILERWQSEGSAPPQEPITPDKKGRKDGVLIED